MIHDNSTATASTAAISTHIAAIFMRLPGSPFVRLYCPTCRGKAVDLYRFSCGELIVTMIMAE